MYSTTGIPEASIQKGAGTLVTQMNIKSTFI